MTEEKEKNLINQVNTLIAKLDPSDSQIVQQLLTAYMNTETSVENLVSYIYDMEGDYDTAYSVLTSDVGLVPDDFDRYIK